MKKNSISFLVRVLDERGLEERADSKISSLESEITGVEEEQTGDLPVRRRFLNDFANISRWA